MMTGALLMIINYVIARRHNFERSDEPFSFKALAVSTYRSSFALLIPIVLVGSVVFGVAGVVEAGALTATITLFGGLLVYRTSTLNNCKMVKAGYPDLQAALVVVVGFLIGSITPPVGVAFFTAGAIANVRLEKVAVAMRPYLWRFLHCCSY